MKTSHFSFKHLNEQQYNDELQNSYVMESPNQILEQSLSKNQMTPIQQPNFNNDSALIYQQYDGDQTSSLNASFNGDHVQINQNDVNIFTTKINDQKQGYHRKDHSAVSTNTFLNLQQFQEHHFVELKFKLEEEVIKNENLERKIRQLEFDNIVKSNEFQRKIQDLEIKNTQLRKQVSDFEKLQKSEQSNEAGNNLKNISDKSQSKNIVQNGSDRSIDKDQFFQEMEQKLISYENEIIMLKERETELLGQINTMRSENFELRLKTERFSFLATKEQQYQSSPRKTYNIQKGAIMSQRQTSGPNVIHQKSQDFVSGQKFNQISGQKLPYDMSQMRLTVNYMGQSQAQEQFINMPGYGSQQRMSSISGIMPKNLFAKINQEQFNVEEINQISEAQSLILQISAEKEQLEQDMELIKEKAINQIIEKEKQIIELIQYHEVQIDELRQENSRLQLNIQNSTIKGQNQSNYSDQDIKQQQIKYDLEITQLKAELQYSEDKYDKLHQKYLEERRQQENDIAFMQDKYQQDLLYFESKIEKLKDKNKSIQLEKDRMNGKFLQSQDFKQEIIKELEDYEQRLKDSEQEKQQLEKDFKYKLESKTQIIQDKSQRIKELQDQLFTIEDEMIKSQSKDSQAYILQISQLTEELSSKNQKWKDSEKELDRLKRKIENFETQIFEDSNKRKVLNEMVQNVQQQRKEMEESYKEKIYNLECQIGNQQSYYLQQIQSLKTTINMLENISGPGGLQYGGAINLNKDLPGDEDQQIYEDNNQISQRNIQTRNSTSYNEGAYQGLTFNTQSTYQNSSPKHNQNQNNQAPKGLSLMDELCDDQFRYSANQMNFSPDQQMRLTQYDNMPRQSMMSNAQFYHYQPENLDNSQL
eukprot:403345423